MRTSRFSVAATIALAATVVPAQVQGEIIAHTDLLLDGEIVAPAGTVLVALGSRAGRAFFASNGNLVCPNHASVGGSWSSLPQPGVPLRFYSDTYYGGFLACQPVMRASGSHAALFRFHAAQPTVGALVISTSVPVAGLSTYAVDVGNDGSVELSSASSSAAGSLIVPLTVQPGAPVEVRVDSSAMGSVNGFASMDVEVQFLEGVLMPTYGTGCRIWNGSRFELTGRYVEQAMGGGTLYLRTENTLVTNHEPFMIFGFQRLNWPIPPTGCLLQTEMLVAVLVPGSGSPVSLDVPVPAGLSGARFNVQCIRASQAPGGGTVSWWTTNGVDVTLP